MIVPETKDWTWVLEAPCPECGFVAANVHPASLPSRIRASLPRWETVLARPEATTRPSADVWSPSEYACHARDVFRIYDVRLALMLAEDDPTFPNWDQDETAVAERYDLQDPAVVADELVTAGSELADRFARVSETQWSRTGHRSDGKDFTVTSFARYFLHDVEHHLWDVAG